MRARTVVGMIVAGVLFLTACGGAGGAVEPTLAPTDDPVANSVRQTVEAIAVAQTVAAITGDTPPALLPTVAPTATGEPPTPGEIALATVVVVDAAPGRCTVVSGVNLRAGPGTAYDPPLAGLGANTVLRPLAFSLNGFPLGQWLQVQVEATGLVGWVSAGPQWIACDIDVTALPPPAVIPPTPRPQSPPTATVPAPTATPTRPVAGAPPDVDNDAPGGSFPTDHVLGNVIVDPVFLFRMDVRDQNVGDFEGAGIQFVEFSVTGNGIDYYRKESTAGYCAFGGGEPICRPWPVDGQGRYTWGEGGPVVAGGEYFASITVTAEQEDPTFGNVWNWNFPFTVTLP